MAIRLISAISSAIAAGNRVFDVMRHVIPEYFVLDAPKCHPHGRNLRNDIDAIAAVVDHPGQAANLALHPARSSSQDWKFGSSPGIYAGNSLREFDGRSGVSTDKLCGISLSVGILCGPHEMRQLPHRTHCSDGSNLRSRVTITLTANPALTVSVG